LVAGKGGTKDAMPNATRHVWMDGQLLKTGVEVSRYRPRYRHTPFFSPGTSRSHRFRYYYCYLTQYC
jgi:hypothetical protein